MSPSVAWTAVLTVRRPSRASADRLMAALVPEAAREVPRARSAISRPASGSIALHIEARDTGALRAALNTYLGWVDLAESTEAAVAAATGEPA